MLIKYTVEGKVEWATSVGGSRDDEINSVALAADGGYIVGGYFRYNMIIGDYTLRSKGNYDGMLIKYSSEGEVEWATSIGASDYANIESVMQTSDGGYIAGGYFESGSIQVGDYTLMEGRNTD